MRADCLLMTSMPCRPRRPSGWLLRLTRGCLQRNRDIEGDRRTARSTAGIEMYRESTEWSCPLAVFGC